MASSDVDQKYLAALAQFTSQASPLMSSSLFQILGLSVMLARKLVRARRLRRLDTSRDTKSMQLYHHIIWLSREGLVILQTFVLPYTQEGQYGAELQVLAAKIQASFFHVFCLFHNNPPITQISIPSATIPPVPLSPRDGNGQTRRDRTPPTQRSGKGGTLRDPVPSYTSEASYLTNPYAAVPPGTAVTPPRAAGAVPSQQGGTRRSPAAPPGLAPVRQPTPSSSFIFPAQNFLPATSSYFALASSLAAQLLSGSHPLRLSVAIEHAAFLWDCVRDGDGSRAMARRAIRDCHAAEEPLSDADFEDAAECVGVLGRMMRREGFGSSPSTMARRSRDTLRSRSGSGRSGATPRASASAGRGAPTMSGGRGVSASDGSPTSTRRSPTSTRSSPNATRTSAAATRSPVATKSARGHGRRSGSGESSSIQASPSPTRSRAQRNGSGGSKVSTRDRKGSHSTKGSGGSSKSRSEEPSPRGTVLRGSGVSRGDRASRARSGTTRAIR